MKTRFYFLTILLLASSIFCSEAKEVEQHKAFLAARNFVDGMNMNMSKLRSDNNLELVYTATMQGDDALRSSVGRPLFYIYNVEGDGGFVIVAADDAVSPILGYADKGEFATMSMPDNLRNWLKSYEKEISFSIKKGYAASDYIRKEWETVLKVAVLPQTPVVQIKTVNWDQTSPYNSVCPMDGRARSLAGCVATSMGIIMKYHQWPTKGTGNVDYTTDTKHLRVNVNLGATYNWDNMLDTYSGGRWTDSQVKEVANLLYHCGAAAYMDYASDASGTTSVDAVDALIDNFGYDKGTYLAFRDLYTSAEWNALLQKELNEGRLLLYGGGTDDMFGHQFVIDGYSPSDNPDIWFYHINWGWNGTGNGNFLLTALDPLNLYGGEGYVYENDVATGLQKALPNSFTNNELFFLEYEGFEKTGLQISTESIVKGVPFNLGFSYLCDYGERDFNGMIGFFITDKSGNIKSTLDSISFSISKGYIVSDSVMGEYVVTTDVEAGDMLSMFYRPEGHEWKPVRGRPGAILSVPMATSSERIAKIDNSIIVNRLTDGSIAINSQPNEAIREVWIFNISGQLVRRYSFTSDEWMIVVASPALSSGAYIINVETTKGRYGKKFFEK